MTPNQAEMLHDIIRESRLDAEEQKHMHSVVANNVDAAARKSRPYIKVDSDGTGWGTQIVAVSETGQTVPIECESFSLDMRASDRVELTMTLRDVEVRLNLETSQLVVDKLGQNLTWNPLTPDVAHGLGIDADAETDEPTWPNGKPPASAGLATGTPRDRDDAALIADREVKARSKPAQAGPHAHDFVDGVCRGCLKRE